MDNQELKDLRDRTIENTTDETTWGGPAGDILTGIRNAENAPAERAIWELVQNARDVSWEDEPAVISFVRKESGLCFSHHGKPFTNTSLESLIKQTSSKVRSDIKTVGKYGTGFLVTHQFGRIIHLAGALQVVDNKDLYYHFPLLNIDRSFEDKTALKNSLKEQSREANSWGYDSSLLTTDAHGLTVFDYLARFDAEKHALLKAFENAPAQTPYVLALNSKYIREITFKDELQSKCWQYRLGENVDKPVGEGNSFVLKRTDIEETGENNTTHTIYTLGSKTIDERVDESIVRVILPIRKVAEDSYEAKLFEKGLAKLYLSLPLIGTENWGLNFIVHSPLFECENDSRNGLRIVPQGLGLPDNENKRMLECAYGMVQEWLNLSLNKITKRKHLGKVSFDDTVKNKGLASYHEELQQSWTGLFENLPIALNDKGVYILPKDLYVIDAGLAESAVKDEDLKEALYEVLIAAHAGCVPAKEDFIYWSETISQWKDDELSQHRLNIEQIVEEVEKLPVQECYQTAKEEWIGRICRIVRYVVETGNEYLLSHKVIPNEGGTLCEITPLCLPNGFSEGFRSIVDEIVPSEKEKFVHPMFSTIGLTGLGQYTEKEAKVAITAKLTELQNAVSNKLKTIETEAKSGRFYPQDTKWVGVIDDRVLNAILRLYTMWIDRLGENMEAKLHRLFADYMGVTGFSDEKIGKENFTDCEQMWRTILFEIMYRFERLSRDEQQGKRVWLKDLVMVLKQYSATEDYLKRAMLYPDQKGICCFADELFSGKEILPEMKEYYDSIVAVAGKTIKSLLVDDEFADGMLNPRVWNNETVADKIEDEVCRYEGYPSLQGYAKKSEVLQLVKRFRTDTEEGRQWSSFFKRLPTQKSTILVSIAESDSVFNLLLQPESRLEKMSRLAMDENCDYLLSLAQREIEKKKFDDVDMQYKKALGLYVENYLVAQLQALLKEGETIKALPDGDSLESLDVQGGQDIIVYVKSETGKSVPIYYIEVKSRWSTRDSVEMSKLQLEVSAREQKHYALCVVDMHEYDKQKVFRNEYPKEFTEIKDKIDVVTRIGERNAELAPFVKDSNTEVHLGGDIKSVVPQAFVKSEFITFDELMCVIENKVREYYSNKQ